MTGTLAVRGGTVVVDDALRRATVVVDGHVIGSIGPDTGRAFDAGVVVDAVGCTVLPGFVDLQVNGAVGADLTAQPERVGEVATFLPRCGVTSFMPTVITAPIEQIDHAVAVIDGWSRSAAEAGDSGARSLGVHVEGPFLWPERRGAHPPQHLAAPVRDVAARWTRARGVAMVTLAPDLPGALELAAALVAAGVVVCVGHTDAAPEVVDAAWEAGARGVTHLFNAMGAMSARRPGPAGAVLSRPGWIAGLIVDGVHVDPAMVRVAWRVLGPERIALVTDAMAALGLPPGTYGIGDTAVVVDETSARTGDGVLAGSVLRFDDAVRNLVTCTGCDLVAAGRAASTTPARLAGRDDIGRIEVGRRGDLVVLDEELRVVVTVVDGRVVWDPDGRASGPGSVRRDSAGGDRWRS